MLNIGVVGTGGMGTVHLSNYAHIEDCKVIALCDKAPAAVQKAQEMGVPLYEDIQQMLQAHPEMAVVDVCTPTFLHPQHVTAALQAGKHVICEKPLALHVAQAKEMIHLAEEKGVQLFVGHVLQYAQETKVLRKLVQEKTYGEVVDASFLRLSASPRWIKNGWLFNKELSGHLPFDLHIHDLDLIVSLFGAPTNMSVLGTGRKQAEHKEHYRFSYSYPNLQINAEAAWYNADYPFTATWRVYFENAVVEFNGTDVIAYPLDSEPVVFDITEPIKIPTGINVPPTGMFYSELTDFLQQIKAGGKGCARKEEVLCVLSLLEEINQHS